MNIKHSDILEIAFNMTISQIKTEKKTKKLKFKEISTREELISRVEDYYGDKVLSTGNKYHQIEHMLSKQPEGERTLEVIVYYTAGSGNHRIVRYI